MAKRDIRLPKLRKGAIYAALALLVILLIIFHVKIVTTITITFVAGLLQYLACRYQIKVEPGHVFFLGILMAKAENGVGALVFFILAGFMPKLVTGDIDPIILFAYFSQAILIFISHFLVFDIMFFGLIISFIAYGIIFVWSLAVDFEIAEILDDTVAPLIFNIIYFISFSRMLLPLLISLYQ